MTFNKNINFLLLVPLCVLVIFCRIVNFFRIKKERNKIILLIDLGHFGDALMLTPSIYVIMIYLSHIRYFVLLQF